MLISALFFACMHLSLITLGIDLITLGTTLVFTFLLGLIAGHLRRVTDSLLPAIVAHSLANIGGMVGGIAYIIATKLLN